MRTIITLDDEKFEGKYYEAAHVTTVDNNGIKASKYVDVKELLQSLLNTKVEDYPLQRIGKLPQGYMDGAIKRIKNSLPTGTIILANPTQRHIIQFESTRYNICYPALLFKYEIHEGMVFSTSVFALKGEKWNSETRLYRYPFGNVSDNGNVCWGSNRLPDVTDLAILDVITSIFYDSPCNNDYYGEKSTKWKLGNLREVLEKLKDMDKFPEDILEPSRVKSIGKITEGL